MGAKTSSRQQQMAAIKAELDALPASPLVEYRKAAGNHVVVGEGSLDAKIMLIGEAPGASEAKTGRPFVGASGRLLDEFLESIGLQRADIYITNVVKDRPPENRDPSAAEIALYAPFLRRQIEIIQPRVVATLGRFAMSFILEFLEVSLDKKPTISDLHGQPLKGKASYGEVAVVPLFHPAVALYSRQRKGTLVADFEVLRAYL